MTARAILTSLLFALPAVAPAADPADLPAGKKHEGELTGELVYHNHPGFIVVNAYSTEYTLTLKAGSKVTAAVTVLGKGRSAGLYLKDPTGKVVAGPAKGLKAAGSGTLLMEEVAATGKYTLVVYSDQIGAYTVKADYTAPPGKDLKAEAPDAGSQERFARIEKELAEVRKELTETKAKVKELQERK